MQCVQTRLRPPLLGFRLAAGKLRRSLLSNAVIGVAGALYGMINGFVTPNGAGLGESLLLVSIVILGGQGNLWGTIVAAALIIILPEKLQAIQEYRLLIFALMVIGILFFRPSGLIPARFGIYLGCQLA